MGRHGLGDRRDRRGAREHRPPWPAAAGQALPGRHRAGPDRLRRRDQGPGREPPPVRPLVRAGRRPPRRPARARAARAALGAAARPPARVRLQPGGPAGAAGADRGGGAGAGRLDGQRHRARRALGQVAAAVRLLQAALRAGHEPAGRPDPRGRRDERRHRRRLRAQPARRVARARPPAGDRAADPAQRRAREAAPGRLERLPGLHARHHVAGRRGPGRARARAGAHLRRGRGGARGRRQHPDPVRPPRGRRARAGPVAARRRGRPPPPRARGHAPAGRPRARVRRAARDPPLRDADRLRRRRDQPVRDVRVAGRAARVRPAARRPDLGAGRAQRRQGHRQGPAQDDLQDGDLDDPVLQRRADLRGRRPRAGARRPLLHRHRVADRRHRARRARARGARAPRAGLPGARSVGRPRGAPAAQRRPVRLAARRRAPDVEPGRDLQAPALGPPRRLEDLRGVRRRDERGVRAAGLAARADEVPLGAGRRHPDSRRSSRRRRSSSASRRARCRSARCRARRTRRWRSP